MNITYQKSSKHVWFKPLKLLNALDQVEALKLPGGIVLTGGASLAGVQELAQEIFGVQVKTYIPEQMGMRNLFTQQVWVNQIRCKLR